MNYYKDINNKPFVFEDNVTAEIIAKVENTHKTTLIEITKADYEALIAPTPEQIAEQKANELKQAKQKALDSITVTVGNNVFDGRDKDQVRMMSALKASAILGQTSTNWKLHNNETVVVTSTDLEQALALSIQEVGRIVNATTIEEL